MWVINQLIMKTYGRKICRVVDKFSNSSTLGVYIQNSTGGSSTMSFTLQDDTFPVAWFSMCRKCPLCSIQTILYPGLHLRSHLPGCLFLKHTLSPILKEGGVLSMVFCAVLKRFSSKVFLAMVNASLWASMFSIPESGSPKNHCIGSNSCWRSSSRLVLGICEILPICHYFVDGKVLRISFQYLIASRLDPWCCF